MIQKENGSVIPATAYKKGHNGIYGKVNGNAWVRGGILMNYKTKK